MTAQPTTSAGLDRSLRLQCACTLLVAVGAAYVSYRHGREFALRFGGDETAATLWPLIVDGLMMTATIELWKINHGARATGQWKAWLSFIVATVLSLCANIASAPELNAFAIAVAACPPLALLLSVELLNQALKRRQAGTDHDAEVPPGAHVISPRRSQSTLTEEAAHTVPNISPGHRLEAVEETPADDFGDPLVEQAYQLDAEHWNLHQRPISADTLRRQLSIGSHRARALTRQVRHHHRSPAVFAAME